MKREDLRTVECGEDFGYFHGLFQRSEMIFQQGVILSVIAVVETKDGVLKEVP